MGRWAPIVRRLAAPLRLVRDLALPPLCPACRIPVAGEGLCAACWSGLTFIAPPYCPRLGLPFAYDPGPGVLSRQAVAAPPAYGRARAAVRYDETARILVHDFKYHDRTDLAGLLGRWMAAAGRELVDEADALVPVPLHWRRLWARRFNQSAMLAGAVSRMAGRPVLDDALCRVRATAQQVGLSASERLNNVQDAFAVPETRRAAIAGRHLVLVDDVLTSGATADMCARTLLRAGAVQVDVLVFARVVDGLRAPI